MRSRQSVRKNARRSSSTLRTRMPGPLRHHPKKSPWLPVRDVAAEQGRVREIRSMAPRPQHGRNDDEEEEQQQEEPAEEIEVVEAAVEAPESDEQASAEQEPESDGVAEDPENSPVAEEDEAVAEEATAEEQSSESEDDGEPAAEVSEAEDDAKSSEPADPAPKASSKRVRMQPMREMKPIGSIKDREQTSTPKREQPQKTKPEARPIVAAPPATPHR